MSATAWQPPGGDASETGASGQADAADRAGSTGRAGGGEPRPPITRVTSGNGQLPNDGGQLWREYDISPYTLRVESTARPEQAIVDWILRETGYEMWHSEPLALLSASERVLRVYHTAEMHKVVANIVDRFVSTEAQTQAFGVRVITLSHPNWRARAQQLMQPVGVQTPGVQAWLLEKEGMAMLLAELRRRSDYREHSSPHLLVSNGQSSVVSATRGRNYVRSFGVQPAAWSGLTPETGLIDEGFSLEFSPLLSVDGQTIDATIKCEIDQVEKMISVPLEVPGAGRPRQRTKIEVPQMAHFRFHERFRWPSDQVLLVGMGMVALPVPSDVRPLVPGLPLMLPSSAPRADMLVFVESKGQSGQARRAVQAGRPEATTYRGRY
ncbi:MAG: hypothetical protein HQ582_16770 [Planctomycetes bacterium]|nr:hypothetical protein [Planctomycetota bacterium]